MRVSLSAESGMPALMDDPPAILALRSNWLESNLWQPHLRVAPLSGDPRLPVLELAVVAGADGRIFRLTGRRDALDRGVVVRVVEEGDRETLSARGGGCRWVDH